MSERGFGVIAEKVGWKKIRITITDGKNDMTFINAGSFTVETDKDFPKPILKAD